jgi:tetratricopeptide (TPR) repeat protein
MIVKNGAATLQRAIGSVAAVADRVLVGDTGSSDDSARIARRAGAEVLRIPWEDDFAQARNRVLAQARCDWILVIDADEMLDKAGPAKLAKLIAKPGVDAYDIVRWNYVRSAAQRSGENPPLPNPGLLPAATRFPAYAITVNTRLFRRQTGVYFEHAVHETVADRLDALGKKRIAADFVLHHLGQAEDDESLRKAKNELYHRLGLKKVTAQPGVAAGWFELGLSELEHHRRPAEALRCFEQARTLDPMQARNSLFCGICLTSIRQLDQALVRLNEALGLGMRSAVLYEALGDVHFHAGRYPPALEAYRQGGSSPLNAAKLGACETVLGAHQEGIKRIRAAIARSPAFVELYDILTAAATLAGDYSLASRSAADRIEAGLIKPPVVTVPPSTARRARPQKGAPHNPA